MDDRAPLRLTLSPGRLALMALAVALALAATNVAVQSFYTATGDGHVFGLLKRFDLSGEGNIPAAVSTGLLLLATSLLACAALAHHGGGSRDRFYWAGLALVFLFLSADEYLWIHEAMMMRLQARFDVSGYLLFVWVVPYGIVTAALGLLYTRFTLRLASPLRWLVVAAGAVYVTGAIGFEVLGAPHFHQGSAQTPAFIAISTTEELLEMCGIILFCYAIAAHELAPRGGLELRLPRKGMAGSAGQSTA